MVVAQVKLVVWQNKTSESDHEDIASPSVEVGDDADQERELLSLHQPLTVPMMLDMVLE